MALTYPGGYITKSPPTPTSTSAPGIWTMDQALQYIKAGTWPTPPIGDPYWQYTALLSGTGSTNGAQNNTFIDSSSNNFTVTRNGNTTQGSFSPFSAPNGYWGNYFDGSGDYLSLSNSADFQFNGQFCVEMWINFSALNTNNFLVSQFNTSGETGWIIRYTGTALRIYAENGAVSIDNSWTPTIGTWSHIAVTRDGSNIIRMFVNGSQIGSNSTNSTTMSATTAAYIGGHPSLSTDTNAYISNLRIVKGSAVYTSNFTPSTTPLAPITNTKLLTCQSNRFIDTNTEVAAKTITPNGNSAVVPFAPFGNPNLYSTTSVGGSGYFDGTGDYLTVADNTALELGSGDFTIEAWIYVFTVGPETQICQKGRTAVDSNGEYAFRQDGSSLYFYYSTSGTSFTALTSSASLLANSWNHVAIVRSGNTYYFWINGVQSGTGTLNVTLYSGAGNLGIAANPVGSDPFTGYISNFRIVKGTAVYTAAFTPPTAPLTAIANTSLLLNFTNAGIYDQAAGNDFETVGNAQVSTSVVKYGSGSMYFDGVGDRLYRENSPIYNFGTGDFTVECWVYIAANTSYATLIDFSADGGGGYGWMLEYSSTRGVLFYMGTGGGNSNISYSFTPPLTTWTHVAVTRAGGYAKIFINGNQVAAASLTSSSVSTNPLVIGSSKNGTYPFNGYLSDVRITKGLARYTYNFTPPTRAFGSFYQAAATPTADPYFDYTTLLLPGSGTNGAQNNTFLDSSTNNFTITRNGNTTQGTFSPFSQTGWSNYFDGSGDYLSGIGTTSSFNFMHNTTALFTAECWVYVNSLSSIITLFDNNNSTSSQIGVTSQIYTDGTVNLFITYGSTGNNIANITTTGIVPTNQWTHIAFVYDQSAASNNGQIYINGVLAGSGNKSGNTPSSSNASNAMRIGCYGNGTAQFMNGYISNFRITNSKVYTTAFTPPTTPLTAIANTALLTCQSNRFIDNSTNAFSITVNGNVSVQAFSPFAPTAAYSAATNGGSGYFDGTGDYLTTPNSSQFAPSGDFTISLWYYPVSTDAYQQVIGNYNASTGSSEIWVVEITSGTGITFYTNGTTPRITGSNKLTVNAWNYIVLARSGSTITGYVNGTSIGTYTQSGTFGSASQEISIGRGGSLTNVNDYAYGYIAGVRLLDGTVDTTVPTAPPVNATGTKLLCNFTNAGITDATAKNDLETVGNAQISNGAAKFGSTSMYFDGTGDYLVTSSSEVNNLSAGDWTVEFWCYPTSASSSKTLINAATSASDPNGTHIWMNTSRQLVVDNTATGQSAFSGGTLTLNTWNHVAIVRYGGTTTGYINGSSVGSNTYTPNTNKVIAVGYLIANAGYDFAGYIQDLRITKGIARYTQNFTPPTAAFQLL